MKPTTTILITVMAISCRQAHIITTTNEKAAEKKIEKLATFESTLNKDYQSLSPRVQFYQEPSLPLDIAAQKSFIQTSGLPLQDEYDGWVRQHSMEESIELYKNFVQKAANHKFINTFKQYQGWLMITRYSMLENTNDKQAEHLKYLLTQLIDAKYQGVHLIYLCLQSLKENKYISEKELNAIVDNLNKKVKLETVAYKPMTPSDIQSPKPMSPATMEMLNKHLKETADDSIYLDKIRQMVK